jgi:hypothetical protein
MEDGRDSDVQWEEPGQGEGPGSSRAGGSRKAPEGVEGWTSDPSRAPELRHGSVQPEPMHPPVYPWTAREESERRRKPWKIIAIVGVVFFVLGICFFLYSRVPGTHPDEETGYGCTAMVMWLLAAVLVVVAIVGIASARQQPGEQGQPAQTQGSLGAYPLQGYPGYPHGPGQGGMDAAGAIPPRKSWKDTGWKQIVIGLAVLVAGVVLIFGTIVAILLIDNATYTPPDDPEDDSHGYAILGMIVIVLMVGGTVGGITSLVFIIVGIARLASG